MLFAQDDILDRLLDDGAVAIDYSCDPGSETIDLRHQTDAKMARDYIKIMEIWHDEEVGTNNNEEKHQTENSKKEADRPARRSASPRRSGTEHRSD